MLSSAAVDEKQSVESLSVKDNPAYRHALLDFANEWKNLRSIECKKLHGKPLQLPLAVELCYLSESNNHNKKVCTLNLNSVLTDMLFFVHKLVHPL